MTKNAKDLRIIENNTAKHFMTKKSASKRNYLVK